MARFDIPDDDRMLWDPYDDKEDSGLLEDDDDSAYEAARDERMFGNEQDATSPWRTGTSPQMTGGLDKNQVFRS